MRLPQKLPARTEHMDEFSRLSLANRDNVGTKDPGMSAGQSIRAFTTDLNRTDLNRTNVPNGCGLKR